MKRLNVGNGPKGLVVGYGRVWVANSLDNTVSRISTKAPYRREGLIRDRRHAVVHRRRRRQRLGHEQRRRHA